MTPYDAPAGAAIADAIRTSGLSIYDSLVLRPDLVYERSILEERLNQALAGFDVRAYAQKTRSKVVKTEVAKVLGYPAPRSFQRVRPRFLGQDMDVYVQESNNMQVWNDEVTPGRRFVVMQVVNGSITRVKVATGETIAALDRTGTLTHKYQARRRAGQRSSLLVSGQDTANFVHLLAPVADLPATVLSGLSPAAKPTVGWVLSIASIYERLHTMVGRTIVNPGAGRDRAHGGALHRLACEALELGAFADRAQVPDILCQVVEVKLQTNGTVDLGLVSPNSEEPAHDVFPSLRHRDMRYAVAYGERADGKTLITGIVMSTGEDFYTEFTQFGCLVRNVKRQIRLPSDFFD